MNILVIVLACNIMLVNLQVSIESSNFVLQPWLLFSQESDDSFLAKMLGNCLIEVKRNFDDFIVSFRTLFCFVAFPI